MTGKNRYNDIQSILTIKFNEVAVSNMIVDYINDAYRLQDIVIINNCTNTDAALARRICRTYCSTDNHNENNGGGRGGAGRYLLSDPTIFILTMEHIKKDGWRWLIHEAYSSSSSSESDKSMKELIILNLFWHSSNEKIQELGIGGLSSILSYVQQSTSETRQEICYHMLQQQGEKKKEQAIDGLGVLIRGIENYPRNLTLVTTSIGGISSLLYLVMHEYAADDGTVRQKLKKRNVALHVIKVFESFHPATSSAYAGTGDSDMWKMLVFIMFEHALRAFDVILEFDPRHFISTMESYIRQTMQQNPNFFNYHGRNNEHNANTIDDWHYFNTQSNNAPSHDSYRPDQRYVKIGLIYLFEAVMEFQNVGDYLRNSSHYLCSTISRKEW